MRNSVLFHKNPSTRNTSGIIGVYHKTGTRVRPGRGTENVDVWVATWVEPSGKRHHKEFSVHKYGSNKLAKKAAIKCRADAIEAIESLSPDKVKKLRKKRALST